MVSTRKKNRQNKGNLIVLDETSNDFVNVKGITLKNLGNELLEPQANSRCEDFERVVDGASQNQVIGSNNYDRNRDAVASAVISVKNWKQHAILTAMNTMLILRVEIALKLITSSSGRGLITRVENSDRKDFTVNTESTPLRSASSRLYLIIEQDVVDETGDNDNPEDGDFPATRPIYDRRAHAHHT